MPYFAVRQGRETGVFDSWEYARALVVDYPTAEFETFADADSANIYLTGFQLEKIHIYTDGSCIGKNPNKTAAWGYVHNGEHQAGSVVGPQTSNRAELLAIYKALQYAQTKNQVTVIHSDSQLAVKTLTQYCKKWQQNGWKTASGNPVKNQDIVKPLISLYNDLPQVTIQWISREHNQDADAVAKAMARSLQRGYDDRSAFSDA